MARSVSSRRTFVESCVELLTRHHFDGLDFDWEYPATRGGKPEDKTNFVLLLKELKEAFKKHNLMLTAAVSAGQTTIDVAYDIPALGKYLDLINLMAYDFHGGWDKTTGHNSPLFARPDETGTQRTLNVDYAVKYWLRKGAPADKLVLGMPLYGRSFSLRDPRHGGLNASITGKGMAGEYTREQGFIGYNEVCKMFQRDKEWKVHVDKYTQAPYAVKNRQWIGYDDVKSISLKVDYLIKMKLAGAMVWSLETDDFRGNCHGHRYPLLQAINSVLNGTSIPLPDLNIDSSIFHMTTWNVISSESSRTTPEALGLKPRLLGADDYTNTFNFLPSSTSTSTTPEAANHTPKQLDTTDNPRYHPFNCPNTGYFRHEKDCRYFYVCQPAPPEFELGYLVHLFNCGSGTVFNQEKRICDYSANVPECKES